MENVPEIVRERLKVAALGGSHPEADELTSFAERSLPETERIAVLEHLARCGDCRDIVALALPATELAETAVRAPGRGRMAWPAFRWGLVAAGVVLIALLGILQHQRGSGNIAAIPATSPQVVSGEARNQPLASPITSDAAKKSDDPAATSSEVTKTDGPTEITFNKKKRGTRAAAPSPVYKQPAAGDLATNLRAAAVAEGTAAQAQSAPLDVQMSEASRFEPQLNASQASNRSNDEDYASDRVGKAKPAFTPQSSATVPTSILPASTVPRVSVIPRWTINPDGVLQRSFDNGATWQPAYVTNATSLEGIATSSGAKNDDPAQETKQAGAALAFRAVTATGTDVWAGGSGAILYHSLDAGDHWVRVVPTAAGTTLGGDVVRIEFIDMLHGTLSTSTAETWTTNDDGRTWQKR